MFIDIFDILKKIEKYFLLLKIVYCKGKKQAMFSYFDSTF